MTDLVTRLRDFLHKYKTYIENPLKWSGPYREQELVKNLVETLAALREATDALETVANLGGSQ